MLHSDGCCGLAYADIQSEMLVLLTPLRERQQRQ